MPDTYTLISKVVLNTATNSVVISNIPQTYTDLVVQMSVRGTAGAQTQEIYVGLNNNTNQTNWRLIQGNGSAAYTVQASSTYGRGSAIPGGNATANTFANTEVYIPNYAGSTQKAFYVTAAQENNQTEAYAEFISELYTQTSAVTSIQFLASNANFAQYTSFYLYGVAKFGVTPTSAPKATGGDRIVTDGTYWYHTFTSSGTFTA